VLTGASSPEAVRDVAAAELRGAAPEPEKTEAAEAAVPVCLECEQTLDPTWALCPFCGAAAPKGDVATALVIDDSRMDRRLVSAALRKEFPRVEEAGDGEHGLDALFRVRPDIVIVDQSMPGLSGIDVIRELRSHLQTAALPVIMLTAGGPEGLEFEALDAGADDYLMKPVSPDRLRARVRSLLASRSRVMARQTAD
jgi:CheY-like chemotaxis protein